MSSGLPRDVAFSYNYPGNINTYIMRLHPDDAALDGCLKFSSADVVIRATPNITKFELELAKSGNAQFRHIRCCHNNKYLSRSSTQGFDTVITASNDEPEEDQSKWSCTLFELQLRSIGGSSSPTVVLRHVATGWFAITSLGGPNSQLVTLSRHGAGNPWVVIDWDSILLLPEYVVFKFDDGKCLKSLDFNPRRPVSADGDHDIGDEAVIFLTSYASDGSCRFLNLFSRRFMTYMRGNEWDNSPIYAYSTESDNSRYRDTLFNPLKLQNSENKMVLKNVGSGRFCRRVGRRIRSFHSDSNSYTAPEGILEVDEAVFSRSIYNVRYRLEDARIYHGPPISIIGSANNNSSLANTEDVSLRGTLQESTAWEHSSGVKTEVKTTFKTGVARFVDGKLTLSFTSEYGRKWGEEVKTTRQIDVIHFVKVPPRSRVTVKLVATKGVCDLPFSYTRRDILGDGRQVITTHDDGLYTAVTHYDFKYETTIQNL